MPLQFLLYAGAAIIILGMLGTAGYKIRESGKDAVRVEWAEANAAAQQAAEADRQRQDALRQAQDKQATRRLNDARKSNATLLTALDAHIRAAGLPRDCRLPQQLWDDANSALAGAEGERPGTVPSGPGPAAPAR